MAKQTSMQFTPEQERQFNELEAAGHGNRTQITRLALQEYYNRFLAQQEVSILSKKAAEVPVHPEVVSLDGQPWLNLGSGLLADAAAQMIQVQFPNVQKRNRVDEWYIYEESLAKDFYAALRVIMIFKVVGQ